MALRIGTAEAGGTFYTQGEAIAELFNRGRPDSEKLAVQTSGASIDNANGLDRGELEFGFMASNWIGRAKEGSPPFHKPISLRMIAPANVGPIFFVTRADSGIQSIDDFCERRIVLGVAGSGMVQHAHTIFSVLGVSFDSFIPVYSGYAQAADALIAGDVAAVFLPPIPNRMITELSQRADIRVVSYSPGQIQTVLSKVPYYRPVTIEKGAFRGVTATVPQIGVVNVIVTHEKVHERFACELTRTISDHLRELPLLNPLFNGIADLFRPLREEGRAAFEFGGVPLHPGAVSAYRERGWIQ